MVSTPFVRSAVSAQLLVRLGIEHGLSAAECLSGSGLSEATLANPRAELLASQELTVVHNLVSALQDPPGLGLTAGLRYHLSTYGIWGFAMSSSATLREAAHIGLRYLDLSFAFVRFSFATRDDHPAIVLDDTAIPAPVRGFLLERDFAAFVNALNELLPGHTPFHAVHFACAQPAYADRIATLCGLQPRYEMPEHVALLNPDCLDIPLPQGNAVVARACESYCRQLLAQRKERPGLAGRVRDLLLQAPQRMPDAEQLSATLNLAPRSLRRKLEQEGTSLRALADEVRQTLAEEMLTMADLKLDEIAERLGYAEPASFIHAFKRWKGQSPAAYRRQARKRP